MIPKHTFLVHLGTVALIATGCGGNIRHAPHSVVTSAREPTPDNVDHRVSNTVDGAQAMAITEVLHRTGPPTLSGTFGAIFFENVSRKTVDALHRLVGESFPRLDMDLEHFDAARFLDNITKKPAMLVRSRSEVTDPSTPIFWITKLVGNVGGESCVVQMKWEQDKWVISTFEINGVF